MSSAASTGQVLHLVGELEQPLQHSWEGEVPSEQSITQHAHTKYPTHGRSSSSLKSNSASRRRSA
jgi:hypothetical protein